MSGDGKRTAFKGMFPAANPVLRLVDSGLAIAGIWTPNRMS
jgi:hypothetical protein